MYQKNHVFGKINAVIRMMILALAEDKMIKASPINHVNADLGLNRRGLLVVIGWINGPSWDWISQEWVGLALVGRVPSRF